MGRFVAKPVIPNVLGICAGEVCRRASCWPSPTDIAFGTLAEGHPSATQTTKTAKPFATCGNRTAVGKSCRVTPTRSPWIIAFPGPHHPVYSHASVLVTDVLLQLYGGS